MKLKEQLSGKKRIWLLMSRDWPAENKKYIEDHLAAREISVVRTTDPAVALTAKPPDVDWILLINDSAQADITYALETKDFAVPLVSLQGLKKTFVEVLRRHGFGSPGVRIPMPRGEGTKVVTSSQEDLVFSREPESAKDETEINQGFFLKKVLDLRVTMQKLGIVRVDVDLTGYRAERLVEETL